MLIKIIIKFLTITAIVFSQLVFANNIPQFSTHRSTSELIDNAVQQRMLIQQVLVSYVYIGQIQNEINPANIKQPDINHPEAYL